MRYFLLILVVSGVLFGGGRMIPAIKRLAKSDLPESGWLAISGFRDRTGPDTTFGDYVEAFFDSAGYRLGAGSAYLDNQNIPWDPGFEEYWLDYSGGFRYQALHDYVFRVTGSASVPCCTIRTRSRGPDVSVLSPMPGDTVLQSQALRVAWRPPADTIAVQIGDTAGNYMVWEGTDTGAVRFSPSQLDSLVPGPVWIVVYRMMMTFEYPGYPVMILTAVAEAVTVELATTAVEEERTDARCRMHDQRLKILQNPTTVKQGVRLLAIGNGPNARLQIYDASGKVVQSLPITNNQSLITVPCNAGGPKGAALPAGVYFVRLYADDATVTKKIVVLE